MCKCILSFYVKLQVKDSQIGKMHALALGEKILRLHHVIAKLLYSSRRHSASAYHVQAKQVFSNPQQPDVGEMLSSALQEQKEMNGRMLMQSIKFLGRQGLPLRGHDEKESNFIQIRGLDVQVKYYSVKHYDRSNICAHRIFLNGCRKKEVTSM